MNHRSCVSRSSKGGKRRGEKLNLNGSAAYGTQMWPSYSLAHDQIEEYILKKDIYRSTPTPPSFLAKVNIENFCILTK